MFFICKLLIEDNKTWTLPTYESYAPAAGLPPPAVADASTKPYLPSPEHDTRNINKRPGTIVRVQMERKKKVKGLQLWKRNVAPTYSEKQAEQTAWAPDRGRQGGRRVKAGGMEDWKGSNTQSTAGEEGYTDRYYTEPHTTPDEDYMQQYREAYRAEREKDDMSQNSKMDIVVPVLIFREMAINDLGVGTEEIMKIHLMGHLREGGD